MNIYIDFDRTLFDTGRFYRDYEKLVESFGIAHSLLNEYKDKCIGGFNPYNVLKEIEKVYKFNNDLYKEVEKLLNNSNNYVYSDVYKFLDLLKKKNYKMILLTKGEREYQLAKVNHTDVVSYFDEIFVTQENKGELKINYEDSIFIDDNPHEIESILSRNPKRMIRIERANEKYNSIPVNGNIEIVETLNDIIL